MIQTTLNEADNASLPPIIFPIQKAPGGAIFRADC